VKGAPGLDLPAVDTAEIADGYGVSSKRVSGREELREALKKAIGSKKPELIEVPVTPGMALF
jgi:benzoylformate decarboxylase